MRYLEKAHVRVSVQFSIGNVDVQPESVVTESDSSSSDVTISLLDRLRSPSLS